MKFSVLVLVCLPLALAEREERLLADKTFLASIFNTPTLLADLQNLIDVVGSDSTKAFCSSTCVRSMANADRWIQSLCPFICASVQSLMNHLHVTHDKDPVQTLKRSFLLGSLGVDVDQLKAMVQQILDLVGSDAVEQVIENKCLDLSHNSLLDSACPFIGRSFQEIIHLFNLHPDPNTPGAASSGK